MSCLLTGLWQTVRGASNHVTVDNCYGTSRSEKYTTTGQGSWTSDCTAHDQATPELKVKVPYWHLECQSELCFKKARPRRWKWKCCFAALHDISDILGIRECRWTGNGCDNITGHDHREGGAIMMSKKQRRALY